MRWRCAASKRDATTILGTGTSAARNIALAKSFCIASAEASTPEWL